MTEHKKEKKPTILIVEEATTPPRWVEPTSTTTALHQSTANQLVYYVKWS